MHQAMPAGQRARVAIVAALPRRRRSKDGGRRACAHARCSDVCMAEGGRASARAEVGSACAHANDAGDRDAGGDAGLDDVEIALVDARMRELEVSELVALEDVDARIVEDKVGLM